MDSSEKIANQYLLSQGFKDVVYEPDGNIPPDFLVDGRIAVEVRRLNQHHESNGKHRGLEEVSIPLRERMEKLLDSLGPPDSNGSWFVSFRYERPLDDWKHIEKNLKKFLTSFMNNKNRSQTTYKVSDKFDIQILKASNPHGTFFLLGGYSDHDSGGWLLNEIKKNFELCLEEKTRKIEKFKDKYPEWWLVLIDHIGYGLDDFDRERFHDQVRVEHDWDKVILIDPRNHERALEISQHKLGQNFSAGDPKTSRLS